MLLMDYSSCFYCGYEYAEQEEASEGLGEIIYCFLCGAVDLALKPNLVRMIDNACLKELLKSHDIGELDIKHIEENDPALYKKIQNEYIEEYMGKDVGYAPSDEEVEFAKLIVPIVENNENVRIQIEQRNINPSDWKSDNDKIRIVFKLGDVK
jgi:hypothetical protein